MDNLILFLPWGLGLMLFSALWVVGWVCRWLLEPSLDWRLERNRTAYHLQEPPSRNGHSPYSLTYPRTTRRGR